MKNTLKIIFGICMGFLVLSIAVHIAHFLLNVVILAAAALAGYYLYKEGVVKDWIRKMNENS